jgi:phage replication O-like protein O
LRAAVDRALAADLSGRELRVFLALVRLVVLFDRLEDRVANRQIVDATGIDERHVRRALHRLDALGVVERTPGRGKVASLVRFRRAEGAETARSEGADLVPSEGAEIDTQRGPKRAPRGGRQRPASEVSSEVSSERGRESRSAGAGGGPSRRPPEEVDIWATMAARKLRLSVEAGTAPPAGRRRARWLSVVADDLAVAHGHDLIALLAERPDAEVDWLIWRLDEDLAKQNYALLSPERQAAMAAQRAREAEEAASPEEVARHAQAIRDDLRRRARKAVTA